MTFLDDLKNEILIADGAMGTLLYSYGVGFCIEELNILQPNKIKQVHEAYLEAGAKVIQTNTFAANQYKLERYSLQHKTKDINKAAVQIAREAAQNKAYVLGTIGGFRGIRKDSLTLAEIEQSFMEQLHVLLNENVDGILLETYYDLEELTSVLKLARQATTLPIISQLTIYEVGITQNGSPLGEAFNKLETLGADIVGINCRFGPHHMVLSMEKVPLPKKAFLSVYPNASLPDYENGKLIYYSDVDYFAEKALELRNLGVRLIGGCCGTTPEHIRAVSAKIKGIKPITEKTVIPQETRPLVINNLKNSTHLHEIVSKKPSVIVEFDPPRHLDTSLFLKGARALNETGIDAITMADNSLATPQICNTAMGAIVKNTIGLRPLIHITCRDRNLIGLQSHLMGLHELGINNVLAVTGDPTKVGDLPGASSVFDLTSFELIQLTKQLNQGLSFSGKSLNKNTSFSVAAAFNPNANNFDYAMKRLEKKIACGADYFVTQPVFDEEKLIQLSQATKNLNVPIYVGIMPLTSSRNAEFLHNEVPGIKLPQKVREIMASCSNDPQAASNEGIAIAKSLLDCALSLFNGIYLITPFMRYELSLELASYVKEKSKKVV